MSLRHLARGLDREIFAPAGRSPGAWLMNHETNARPGVQKSGSTSEENPRVIERRDRRGFGFPDPDEIGDSLCTSFAPLGSFEPESPPWPAGAGAMLAPRAVAWKLDL